MDTRYRSVLMLTLCLLSLIPVVSRANPLPAEACCFYGGECRLEPVEACYMEGGLPLEGVWSCEPNPCLGACCTESGSCVLTDFFSCVVPMGRWLGAGANCEGDPCQMGACCLPNGTCAVLHESECVAQGGSYSYDGYPCPWTPCGAEGVDARFPATGLACVAAPNPFTTETAVTVAWEGTASAPALGVILDAAGRHVRNLELSTIDAGHAVVEWNGRDDVGQPVPAGVYFVTVRSGGQTGHAVLLRLR